MEKDITIKKKNGFMMFAAFLEVLVGIGFIFSQGIRSILPYIMFFAAILTALTAYDESCEEICLKEHKFEVIKRKDILQVIKYKDIRNISYEKGKAVKDKRKTFIRVEYDVSSKKSNKTTYKDYYLDTSYFSKQDLNVIVNKIKKENTNVILSNDLKEYISNK